MAEGKYRVTIPGSHVGERWFYGIHFENGVAQNVPDGFHMGDFKDRGFVIEPMVPGARKETTSDEPSEVAGGAKPPTPQRKRRQGGRAVQS